MTKFSDITLPEPIIRAATHLGYETLTPIQDLVIPWLLENSRDLVALAQTGTGKTAAFGFPILSETDIENSEVQTIILCPTRELCLQITHDLESYAKYLTRIRIAAIYGGASIQHQKESLRSGIHIVVGTPGRVNDMIRQGALKLGHVSRLVLDEADEMLNMGFKEELFEIMKHIPDERQTMLFSATMPKDVEHLASQFMKEPERFSVGNENKGAENIQHYYYKVQAKDKYMALKRIADMSPKIYGIVFCKTRRETQEIADKLQQDGYNADALHGDLSQGQRELVMSRFRSRFVPLLIATDVAARGLDVDDLTHIINFHVPQDPDVYIHRSGRTGRAGKSGISISIIHSKEISALRAAEKRLGFPIVWQKVPGGREICEKQLYHFIDTVERVEVNEEEMQSFMANVFKKLNWMTREDLIKRFVAVEFNRFLNYYKDIPDLDNLQQIEAKKEKKDKSGYVFSTFRLNIGYDTGLTKRDLMKYINSLRVGRGIEIGRIDIYGDYCLVDLDERYEHEMLKAIANVPYKDRAVQAKVSPQKGKSRFEENTAKVKSYKSSKSYGGKREESYRSPRSHKDSGYSSTKESPRASKKREKD
ncbi:MAG: DEAD/DEAH box helicase [Candidatus Cloacimonetes bacterium]|nr:DEAD/DEAH box helicase [Candidatus Cloacimonadota bacterium]